jgi:phosphate-selective porin OprO/OprP
MRTRICCAVALVTLICHASAFAQTPLSAYLPKVERETGGEAAQKEAEALEPGQLFARFEDGVLLSTKDEEFQLRIHVLGQIDYKLFEPTYQQPARSGVYIPRFRAYFEGRATRSFDYELSLQRSVEGTFDVLDANINYHPSNTFQVKFGRMLVPYSYEWYDHLEQFFIVPERSLYPLNFGLSRQAGVMIHGKVLDERVQYALGGFAGQLAGVADNNTSRDAVGYLNIRPFLHTDEWPALRYINIGGSLALGRQVVPESPLPLRTSVQSSENDEAASSASTSFLEFRPGVANFGNNRISGALHFAWYCNQLSIEAEYQAGRFPYSVPGNPNTVMLPVNGFGATAAYFLTGETVEGRKVVVPLRPFNPVSGQVGTGAIEPFARYSQINLGQEVFTAGLADPDKWTRSAQMTDIGANWYPNRYLKFTFDWQRTHFGTPIVLNEAQDLRGSSVNLFWLRCQVWY